jgi:SAM-dependent methyltransferase
MRIVALRPPELVRRLALAPDAVVADLGAGPGFLTLELARAVPRGRVIATDLRADYLAYVAARAADAHLANVETRVVAADAPGLAKATIDLALLCQVDHGLADRAAYFRRVAEALRPGGRVALVNYARYRAPDLEAARAAGLRVLDEWAPSKPFFVLVLGRATDARR